MPFHSTLFLETQERQFFFLTVLNAPSNYHTAIWYLNCPLPILFSSFAYFLLFIDLFFISFFSFLLCPYCPSIFFFSSALLCCALYLFYIYFTSLYSARNPLAIYTRSFDKRTQHYAANLAVDVCCATGVPTAHPLGNSRTQPAIISRKNVVIHNCDFHRFRFTYSYFVAADGHHEITVCMNTHMGNFKCSWRQLQCLSCAFSLYVNYRPLKSKL